MLDDNLVNEFNAAKDRVMPILYDQHRIHPLHIILKPELWFNIGDGIFLDGSQLPEGQLYYIVRDRYDDNVSRHWSVPATPDELVKAYQYFIPDIHPKRAILEAIEEMENASAVVKPVSQPNN